MTENEYICTRPADTFALGEKLGALVRAGDVVLLYGGLGGGKTLLTKGILGALSFDVDEVTSPSFTLVNLYKTEIYDVYHADLWRLDAADDPAMAIGLDEILENEHAITIIEWAERLGDYRLKNPVVEVRIDGDGDDARKITVKSMRKS
jgi:tRNA threonylcarbamoyladenosine biosynthesis protein TsaE